MDTETKRQLLQFFIAPVAIVGLGVFFFVAHAERSQFYARCEAQCRAAGSESERQLAFPPLIVPECKCKTKN
jgi:hypothetical protein